MSRPRLVVVTGANGAGKSERVASPPMPVQAASDRSQSGLQFQGSSSSMRLLGCPGHPHHAKMSSISDIDIPKHCKPFATTNSIEDVVELTICPRNCLVSLLLRVLQGPFVRCRSFRDGQFARR